MPIAKITGTTAPILTEKRISYDKQRGLQTAETWESAGDNLESKASEFLAAGVQYEFDRSSTHRQKVIATYAGGDGTGGDGDDIITDTWQLLANEIQKDGRECALAAALGSDVIAGINANLEANKTLTETGYTSNTAKLYSLLLRGSTHFATTQYALRHTTNVANDYSVNAADVNVECIYTTSQLVAEITDGNLWAFPCPGRLIYKIQHITAPAARTDYLWGWRKLASTETTASNGRIDITTEYWLEQWSLVYYSTAS